MEHVEIYNFNHTSVTETSVLSANVVSVVYMDKLSNLGADYISDLIVIVSSTLVGLIPCKNIDENHFDLVREQLEICSFNQIFVDEPCVSSEPIGTMVFTD